jgi:hypothetical protein
VDLPVRGMALGHRPFTADDGTIAFVHHGDGTVARFVARADATTATFTIATGLVDAETRVLGEMSATTTSTVPLPALGTRVFLDFHDEGLVVDDARVDDGSVFLARDGLAWHVALEVDADGPRLVLSPAAVALMMPGDVEETRPPEVEP